MFDLDIMSVDSYTHGVNMPPGVRGTDYWALHDKTINMVATVGPDREALAKKVGSISSGDP